MRNFLSRVKNVVSIHLNALFWYSKYLEYYSEAKRLYDELEVEQETVYYWENNAGCLADQLKWSQDDVIHLREGNTQTEDFNSHLQEELARITKELSDTERFLLEAIDGKRQLSLSNWRAYQMCCGH
jgi:hypothetical protein